MSPFSLDTDRSYALRSKGGHIGTYSSTFQAVPVTFRLHKGRGDNPCSPERTCLLPNLQPVVRPCVSTGMSSLRASVQVPVVSMNASTGWGAMYKGHASLGIWTGSPTALAHQLPRVASSTFCAGLKSPLRDKHALVHTDSTVIDINNKGGLHSRCMSQLAHHLLPIFSADSICF